MRLAAASRTSVAVVVALLAATATTAQLRVVQGKFSLVDSVGITAQSIDIDSTSASNGALPQTTLQPTDTLRLTFLAQDGNEPVQPEQAMILWQPVDPRERAQPGRDHLSVVKVRKGGKARWELDLSRAPTSLLSVSRDAMTATLLVGHSRHSTALSILLGTFVLSPSLSLPFPYPPNDQLPKAWQVERYAKMPEIHWTFKNDEKEVRKPIAFAGTLFVLAPWVVFSAILAHIKPTFASPTLNILSFLLCLISFESLIVAYWTSLKLLPTLPYFGLLAVLTAFTGRRALGDVRSRRLAREAQSGGKME